MDLIKHQKFFLQYSTLCQYLPKTLVCLIVMMALLYLNICSLYLNFACVKKKNTQISK